MRLTREVRLSVVPEPVASATTVRNGWAGWPPAVGIVPYLICRVTIEGEPDPTTGYLCDIREIDARVRAIAVEAAGRAVAERQSPEQLLLHVHDRLDASSTGPGRIARLTLATTPFLEYAVDHGDARMTYVTQSFEFSAAHRLHCASLSDEENRTVFGKCNNPSGHGHNYRLDVTVAAAVDDDNPLVIGVGELEAIVKQCVIDRLDHKHLNLDCPEFAERVPSIENIAAVIWDLVDGRFGRAHLHRVRAWETPKTYVDYFGQG
jgi:6-pyruvoyltetrahydropterin/6-carboxytetrahydropterin synthase